MSALEVLEPIFRVIPEVKSPVHREDFNEKLKWTGVVLVLYFILKISLNTFTEELILKLNNPDHEPTCLSKNNSSFPNLSNSIFSYLRFYNF